MSGRKLIRLQGWLLILLLAAALAGCASESTPTPAPESFKNELLFSSQFTYTSGGSTIIDLYMVNTSASDFPGDDDFQGRMEIRPAGSGALRAAANIYQVGPLDAGARRTQLTWEGVLDPGGYTLRWGAEGYSYITTEFTVP